MSEHKDTKHNPFVVAAVGLFAGVVIGGVVLNAYWFSTSEFRLPAYLDELEKELGTIPLPVDAQANTEVLHEDKRISMRVFRRYRSTLNAEELEFFFVQSLVRQGWRLGERRMTSGRNWILTYCKNDVHATVQLLESKRVSEFSVGVAWPNGPECQEGSQSEIRDRP